MELYGGYAYDRFTSAGTSANLAGGLGSFGWNLKPWLQIVGFDGEGAAATHDPTFGFQPLLFKVLPIGIAFGIGEAF